MQHHHETTEQQDDTHLLSACLNGNQDAWTVLVQRYERLVFSIALKAGLDHEDAADVTQNVFTIVLRHLESLQHRDRFSAWLITVTHRESWRVGRRHQESTVPENIDPVDSEPGMDARLIAWEQASMSHQALHQLGDRCRLLLAMLFLREPRPAYEAISAELGIAVGSIGPIRARCLKQLKDKLANLGVANADS